MGYWREVRVYADGRREPVGNKWPGTADGRRWAETYAFQSMCYSNYNGESQQGISYTVAYEPGEGEQGGAW